MTEELQKKVDRAVRLIKSVAPEDGSPVEVAYSGGKDSDVCLELTKMAGIPYRAIYKCTTIDPPGTIPHVKEQGAEILRPKKNFFELIADNAFPNRFTRFCCRYLKEYKVLDKAIMGVRRAESTKRASRYKEPTECRFYGSKKEHVEAIYPILEWTDEDVLAFIQERKLKIHPLYYREDGSIDVSRRVGCMCCPLASTHKRVEQFQRWPNMVKAYLRAGRKFRETHPDAKTTKMYKDEYEWFVRDVFFERQWQWELSRSGMFDAVDCKTFLEEKFGIDLTNNLNGTNSR